MNLVSALRLIGQSPEWVGAFVSHPKDFRSLLTSYKRAIARSIHPDVAAHISLSQQSGPINNAFRILEEADDKTLTAAMRQFADLYALPSRDVIAVLSSLKDQNETLQKQSESLAKQIAELEAAKPPPSVDVRLLYELLLTPYRTYSDYNYGELLNLENIRSRYFHTPIIVIDPEDTRHTPNVLATSHLCYVDEHGRLHEEGINEAVLRTSTKEEVKKVVYARIKRHIRAFVHNVDAFGRMEGTVIGFVNTNHLHMLEETGTQREVFPSYAPFGYGMDHRKKSAIVFLEACVKCLEWKTRFFDGELADYTVLDTDTLKLPKVGLVVLGSNEVKDPVTGEETSSLEQTSYTVIYIDDFYPIDLKKETKDEL